MASQTWPLKCNRGVGLGPEWNRPFLCGVGQQAARQDLKGEIMDKERFSAFLLGLSVGVGISLLVAPKSGRETRASIRDKAGEGTEYLRQRGTVVKQTAAAWVDKGKEALSRNKDPLTEAVESDKLAYRGAVSQT